MAESPQVFQIEASMAPPSLERFVATALAIDHRLARAWIKAGHVLLDGHSDKPGRLLRPGQRVEVRVPPPAPHPARPEALPLPIRYLDQDLIVVAKPAGMATHPGPGWWQGSCVNALLHAIPDWPGIGGVAGPGIVHRLDRDTSGLLLFARSQRAHQALLAALRAHLIEREYLAWVAGPLAGQGQVDAPLGRDPAEPKRMAVRADGKSALTRYRSLICGPERSLLALQLETGRQHQIRVHMAHLGHPVWGDQVYGTAGPLMALHAWRLKFAHPVSGEPLDFCEPPPPAWEQLGELPWES